jgi:hypothetical protein
VSVAQITTQELRNFPSLIDYRRRITVDHAVIRETIGHHLPGPGQRNMALDHKDLTTHPRFNHRSGTNGAAKKEVFIRDRLGTPQHYILSRETDVIHHGQIGQYLVGKIPARPNIYDITPPTLSQQPSPDLGNIGAYDSSTLAIHYQQCSKKPKVVVYVHGSF